MALQDTTGKKIVDKVCCLIDLLEKDGHLIS